MKTDEVKKILICLETNFERISFFRGIFLDFGRIFIESLEIIVVTIIFFFLLIYVLFLEKSPELLLSIAVVYFTLVTLIVANAPARKQLLGEVELNHNIREIENSYSRRQLFRKHYPIIKALILLKQKNPEISLLQLYDLNKEIFRPEALIDLLCSVD